MDNSLEKTYKMVALGLNREVDIQKEVKLFTEIFKNNEENSCETTSEPLSAAKEIPNSILNVIILKFYCNFKLLFKLLKFNRKIKNCEEITAHEIILKVKLIKLIFLSNYIYKIIFFLMF